MVPKIVQSFICPRDYLSAVLLGEFSNQNLSTLNIGQLNTMKHDVLLFIEMIRDKNSQTKFPGLMRELEVIMYRIQNWRAKAKENRKNKWVDFWEDLDYATEFRGSRYDADGEMYSVYE